jgi:hypothetical protein
MCAAVISSGCVDCAACARSHVLGVLQDVVDLAVAAEQWRVGGAPVAVVQAAVRLGDGIVDRRDVVGRARLQHMGKGLPQLPPAWRFRVARKGVEHAPAQYVGTLAHRHTQVGTVGRDDLEVGVEQDVGIGRRIEQRAGIQGRQDGHG